MDGTQSNKGQMRKLTVLSVCFIASLIGAALIPAKMITGMSTIPAVPDQDMTIHYQYTASLPERLGQIQDAQERKQCLIEILLPLALKANETILKQRLLIEEFRRKQTNLTNEEKKTLAALADLYMVEPGSTGEMIQELLRRADVLPVSLILAQAAIESGWGTSRFSLEGNNIFGLRTPTGIGMIPVSRSASESHAVSEFDDLQSCIDYYLWNINTNPQYEELRHIRSLTDGPYDAYALAQGLRNYSEQGGEYIRKVEKLISCNALKYYDDYRLQ